jgi:hypothetical protein
MNVERSIIELEKMQKKIDGLRVEKMSLENSIAEGEKKLNEKKQILFEKFGLLDDNLEQTQNEIEKKIISKVETLQKKIESY